MYDFHTEACPLLPIFPLMDEFFFRQLFCCRSLLKELQTTNTYTCTYHHRHRHISNEINKKNEIINQYFFCLWSCNRRHRRHCHLHLIVPCGSRRRCRRRRCFCISNMYLYRMKFKFFLVFFISPRTVRDDGGRFFFGCVINSHMYIIGKNRKRTFGFRFRFTSHIKCMWVLILIHSLCTCRRIKNWLRDLFEREKIIRYYTYVLDKFQFKFWPKNEKQSDLQPFSLTCKRNGQINSLLV